VLNLIKKGRGERQMGKDLIDETDQKIMKLLQQDARMPLAKISQHISMSPPSVKERITKLEEKGIITGYQATFDLDKLDRGMTTFLMLKTEKCQRFIELCRKSKWITDLYRISGEYNFLLKIQTNSLLELKEIQNDLMEYGPSKSFIGMEQLISNQVDISYS
jgi:DNA-binding Lrp family transcriptional regulator